MKFAILMLCLTIVHSSFLSNDIAKMKYYRSLIDHLHRENYAKGVLIISNVDYNCFDEMTYWHETSRKMSNRGIATDIVNFKVLKQNLPFYTNQIRHILFVIIIQNMDEVNLFAEINFNSNWSESPWVILFSGNNNQDVCEFCREPHRNVFNLKFNSDIVVVCCNSTDINEWWSATGDYTQVRKLAQWIDEKRGVEWLPKKSLYERRTSLEGRPLRIGIVKRSTDIWIDQGDFNGYLGKVLKALSQLMNFTISTVISEHSYGTWDPELSEWTGALGRLQRNEVDMVVSSFIMTADRFRVADFTIPTVYENSRLYFKKPGVTTVQWNAYFKAFSTDVWLVIIALILIVPLLLTIIQSTERLCFFPLVFEHYLSVWGIYCQQGLPELPEKTPLRIVYTSAFLSALIITMAYSASLTSFLAVSLSPLPFKTMDEFAKLGTYELIAIIDSADYVWLKLFCRSTVENKWKN
uniref:GRIK2_2 protein n=1 Tax=Fopius arisanus TaxID=64838 RepID=A0A0C9QLX8_9HYME